MGSRRHALRNACWCDTVSQLRDEGLDCQDQRRSLQVEDSERTNLYRNMSVPRLVPIDERKR